MSGGNYMLIADEAALPALDARLRALGKAARIIILAEGAPARPGGRNLTIHSVDRKAAFGPRTLNDALKGLFLPQDRLQVWLSCDRRQARLIRAQLIEDHGVRPENVESPAGPEPALYTLDALA